MTKQMDEMMSKEEWLTQTQKDFEKLAGHFAVWNTPDGVNYHKAKAKLVEFEAAMEQIVKEVTK